MGGGRGGFVGDGVGDRGGLMGGGRGGLLGDGTVNGGRDGGEKDKEEVLGYVKRGRDGGEKDKEEVLGYVKRGRDGGEKRTGDKGGKFVNGILILNMFKIFFFQIQHKA
jgi:hypothetical protein